MWDPPDAAARQRSPVRFERRVALLALVAPLPSVALALLLISRADWSVQTAVVAATFLLLAWLLFAWAVHHSVVRPVQTLANLLGALREGDLSIRARGARPDDALGLALLEINSLGETLRNQRVGAHEASALLQTVIDEIDVALVAFDGSRRVRFVNRSGQRLLGRPESELVGQGADDLDLAFCLEGEVPRTVSRGFAGSGARWELRRSEFRQGGRPHALVVLSDVTRALREEELQAWQRIIRVLSHELNNSLAPIKSIAGSLRDMVTTGELGNEDRDDLRQGLGAISDRSASLSRFIAAYARLARLPEPTRRTVDVESWVRRVATIENRLAVDVFPGPATTVEADGDQLDQLLINLVRNAVDASLEAGEETVEIGWERAGSTLEVWVRDLGAGVADTSNLFVPFFTTKPAGSGIGLALSRQIAEAHGGTLTLENRQEGRGAEARVQLPLTDR